jgi:signal transduction histidine kinase
MKFLLEFTRQFLSSGFDFTPKEELLKQRLKLFNTILGLIILTAGLLAATSFFGIYQDVNKLQSLITSIYVILMILIVLFLRRSKSNYKAALITLLITSLAMFGITLYNVSIDHSRIFWFSPLVLTMFVLGGKKMGFISYFTSIAIILSIHLLPNRLQDFTHLEIAETIFSLSFIALIASLLINRFVQETGTLVERVEEEVEKNRQKDEELLRSSKLAQMGELLSIISHQWKQPLSTISIYTADSIIGLEMGDRLSKEDQKDIYLAIDKQVKFLSKTMDDFRHFYNPNKDLKLIHMPHVIDQAIEILKPEMQKSNITIHTGFHFNLPLHSFPNEITQAVLILLKNAKDAHDENKKKHQKRIHISGFQEKGLSIIEIRDNAGGVDPENLPHLFKQFFTTKDSNKGTGLGLYLCKTIIEESCRGEIKAERIDDGMLFKLSIPSQK